MKLNTLNKAIAIALATSAITLAGCIPEDGKNGAAGSTYSTDLQFTEIAPAITDQEKNKIRTTDGVTIAGETQAIDYHTLIQTGDVDNGETFGAIKDQNDVAILNPDSTPLLCNGTGTSADGSGLDHVSYLQKNGKIYMVSQFECGIGAMYVNELTQASDGQLSVTPGTLKYISQKDDFGGWVHCAGVTTPWQSHLGSEEYEPDANPNSPSYNYTANSYYTESTDKYWNGVAADNNPYYYGWTPEVTIDANGDAVYTKHYSMGRVAHELAYVMPDEKTLYLTDDGTNGGLYMFVADTAADLSAGTLYAAKWNQTSSAGLGEATITWVNLGHATDADIKTVVAAKKSFSDIFDTETPNTTDGTCSAGFTNVNTSALNECLKLKDVNGDSAIDDTDKAIAARLETRRMAAIGGATTEFSKEEGITFNPRDRKLYIAMSQIRYGMEDNAKKGDTTETKYDFGGSNDITLDYNKCGGVYGLDTATNSTIGSDYVVYSMKGLVAGVPTDYTGTALEGNSCDVTSVSNPDNVDFLEGSDILAIGEDTSYHPNDMVWSYNIKNKSLERLVTLPYGSETTSPYWYKDINGKGYLSLTVQHPYGEVSSGYVTPSGASIKSEAGYIGPMDFSKLK